MAVVLSRHSETSVKSFRLGRTASEPVRDVERLLERKEWALSHAIHQKIMWQERESQEDEEKDEEQEANREESTEQQCYAVGKGTQQERGGRRWSRPQGGGTFSVLLVRTVNCMTMLHSRAGEEQK